MFAQEDPLVARSNRQVLHLLAYAVWKALAAAQVLVAVDDSSAVMVQGWAGSAALDVDECLVTGVDNIPVEAVTDVRLERLADGSLHVWHEVPPRQGADQARDGGPTGRALRSSARDGVGLVVLVDRPSVSTAREEGEQTLRSLLAAAQDVIAAQQEVNKQRLRSRLEEREDERRRWARELHDETLQQMGALQVLLTSTLRGAETTVLDHDAVLRSLGQASTMLTSQISTCATSSPSSGRPPSTSSALRPRCGHWRAGRRTSPGSTSTSTPTSASVTPTVWSRPGCCPRSRKRCTGWCRRR